MPQHLRLGGANDPVETRIDDATHPINQFRLVIVNSADSAEQRQEICKQRLLASRLSTLPAHECPEIMKRKDAGEKKKKAWEVAKEEAEEDATPSESFLRLKVLLQLVAAIHFLTSRCRLISRRGKPQNESTLRKLHYPKMIYQRSVYFTSCFYVMIFDALSAKEPASTAEETAGTRFHGHRDRLRPSTTWANCDDFLFNYQNGYIAS